MAVDSGVACAAESKGDTTCQSILGAACPERPEPGLSSLSLLLGSKTKIFSARAGRQRGGSRRPDTAEEMYQEQL